MKHLKSHWSFYVGLFAGLAFSVLNFTGFTVIYFPGDLGDARFNLYILEHAHQFFSGNLASYWDAPFMYPMKSMISWSDNLLGTAPFYSVFRMLGADREMAFSLWYIFISILNYSAAYIFLNKLMKNSQAAAVGAMVFAFSIALNSQLVAAQTFPRFPIPIALLFIYLFYQKLHPKYLILAVLIVVYQFYCGIYLGMMLGVVMLLAIVLVIIMQRKELLTKLKEWRWMVKTAGGVLLAGATLLLLMLPYVSSESEGYPYEVIDHSIPTIQSYLYGQFGSIWSFTAEMENDFLVPWIHQLFPGAIAILSFIGLIVVIIYRRFSQKSFLTESISRAHIFIFLTALLSFLFFVRIGDFSLYRLIYELPGFYSIRAVQRIININLIFFAFSVTALTYLALKNWYKLRVPIFFLVVVMLIIDNYQSARYISRTPHDLAQELTSDLRKKMEGIPKGTIVSYEPLETGEYPIQFYQITAMLVAQEKGLKCLNGYTSKVPEGYWNYGVEPNEVNRMIWLDIMERKDVPVVVIH
jgi:hypothetical protein